MFAKDVTHPPGLKIMVIDNETASTQAVLDSLSRAAGQGQALTIKAATDAYAVLPELFRFRPDLVFIAAELPLVDGYTMCRAIKESRILGATRVVVVTKRDGLIDRARGFDAGADDYLVTPITADAVERAAALSNN